MSSYELVKLYMVNGCVRVVEIQSVSRQAWHAARSRQGEQLRVPGRRGGGGRSAAPRVRSVGAGRRVDRGPL